MGLGKTRQAIVALREACPDGCLLVVCPASLKINWVREIRAIELHLEGIGLKPGTAPPEDGTALLTTLQRWSATGSAATSVESVLAPPMTICWSIPASTPVEAPKVLKMVVPK